MKRSKTFHLIGFILLLLTTFAVPNLAFAQDAEPTPEESDELKRLKALQAEAEARKAIAEARKAELEARFPKSTMTPLEGKTTVGDDRVEEKVLGYMTVGEAANRIADKILANNSIKLIAIHNQGDVELLLVYAAATKRIDAYIDRYNRLIVALDLAITNNAMWTPSPCDGSVFMVGRGSGAPLGIAASLLGSFGEILSFFRTDVEIKGSIFEIEESVLVTEVFRAIRARNKEIALYYPKEFPPAVDPSSPMLNRIDTLFQTQANANDRANTINQMIADKKKQKEIVEQCISLSARLIGKLQKEIDDAQAAHTKVVADKGTKTAVAAAEKKLTDVVAKNEPEIANARRTKRRHENDLERLEREIAALQAALVPLTALNVQAEILVKDMIKVDEKSGINPLTAFIRSERIQALMNEHSGHWLKLQVVEAGGNTKIKRNLFVDIFNGGNRVFYSGASIIEYHLYDRFGKSVFSDTTNSYIDYKKAKDVKKFTDTQRPMVDVPD